MVELGRRLGAGGGWAAGGAGAAEEARLINERFRARSGPAAAGECVFVCECDLEGCESGVLLSIADYDAIRSDAAWFALAPGHERPTDNVVRRGEQHVVVSRQISDLLFSAVRGSDQPERPLGDGSQGARSRGEV